MADAGDITAYLKLDTRHFDAGIRAARDLYGKGIAPSTLTDTDIDRIAQRVADVLEQRATKADYDRRSAAFAAGDLHAFDA